MNRAGYVIWRPSPISAQVNRDPTYKKRNPVRPGFFVPRRPCVRSRWRQGAPSN